MSISDVINDAIARGQIFRVEPRMESEPMVRALYASLEVRRLMFGPWLNDEEDRLSGNLWAAFDRFVVGHRIPVSLNSPFKKPKDTYLSRMDPTRNEVWEIRIRDPRPAIRVFGRFAYRDCFVVFNWGLRKELGGPSSREFQQQVHICLSKWRQIFPSYNAFSGDTVDEYISEKQFSV